MLLYPDVPELSLKGEFTQARHLEERRHPGVRRQSDGDEATFCEWQRRASDRSVAALREEDTRVLTAQASHLADSAAHSLPGGATIRSRCQG